MRKTPAGGVGHRTMIADRPHPQTLPILPAYLCVLGSGLAASVLVAVSSFWNLQLQASDNRQLTLLVSALVGSLLGAWALRLLVRGVCGFELSYWHAYVSLAAGDLLNVAFVAGAAAWLEHTNSRQAAGYLPTLFGPQLVALILTVYLVRHFAIPLGVRSTAVTGELFNPPVDAATGQSQHAAVAGERDLYDEIVSAARDASLGLVDLVMNVPPVEVPGVVANGLARLEVATRTLQERGCPVPELVDAHRRLVEGLERLGEDLVEASEEAARTADLGARYRWQLSNAAGVKAVTAALDELGRHGLGTTW